jgi:hypothetical protein
MNMVSELGARAWAGVSVCVSTVLRDCLLILWCGFKISSARLFEPGGFPLTQSTSAPPLFPHPPLHLHTYPPAAGYTAVYFDELDPSWCGWWGTDSSKGNCSGFSNETQQDQAHAYYSMAANMTQRLNDCGIVPIFAAFGVLEASGGHGINPHNPCVLWEDELVAALDGLQWARFYEQWPDQFHMRAANHSEADRFAQVLTNGILEGQAGIAVVAHTTQGLTNCSNTSAAESDEAPFVPSGTAAFHLASFLIAQGPNWVYGVSSAWTDNAFCWHRSYDVQCGHPLGVANRIGPYTFTRNFTGCDVSVETVGLIGEIRLK